MKKFIVLIHYKDQIKYEVEAKTEEEAKDISVEQFLLDKDKGSNGWISSIEVFINNILREVK